MTKYEAVIIVDATLAQEEKENIHKQCQEAITKNGGKVINSQIWLEKQKFAFRMKRCPDGTYYLINFEAVSGDIVKIRQNFKLNESILRFAIFVS